MAILSLGVDFRYHELEDFLASLGYQCVRQEKHHFHLAVTCFFKPKFSLVWCESRSRVLITALRHNLEGSEWVRQAGGAEYRL